MNFKINILGLMNGLLLMPSALHAESTDLRKIFVGFTLTTMTANQQRDSNHRGPLFIMGHSETYPLQNALHSLDNSVIMRQDYHLHENPSLHIDNQNQKISLGLHLTGPNGDIIRRTVSIGLGEAIKEEPLSHNCYLSLKAQYESQS